MVRVALLCQRAATNCGIALWFHVAPEPSRCRCLSLYLSPSRTYCVCWFNLDTLNFHYILMEITHLFMAPSMDDADTEIARSSRSLSFPLSLSFSVLPSLRALLGYYTNSPQSIAQHTFCVPNVHTFAPAAYPSLSLSLFVQPAAPFRSVYLCLKWCYQPCSTTWIHAGSACLSAQWPL